jgi:hypothetical protein
MGLFKSIAPNLALGGLSLLGTVLQNKQAKNASARQMAFQENMSNTSYQRAVKDMRKAGINPLLAYKMGGASSPSGSTYQPANIGSATAQGFMQGQQLDQIKAATRVAEAQADIAEQDAIFAKKYGVNPNSSAAQILVKGLGTTASGLRNVFINSNGKYKTEDGKTPQDLGLFNHRNIPMSEAERGVYRLINKIINGDKK